MRANARANGERQTTSEVPLLHGTFQTETPEELLHSPPGSEGSLRRALGPLQVTVLGVGAIIGIPIVFDASLAICTLPYAEPAGIQP